MATEVEEKAPDFTLPSDSWENKVSLEEKGARVLGISVDSPWSHKAWAEERGIGFPLLSDFGREVAEEYGVKHKAGFPERASFAVDRRVSCGRKSRTRRRSAGGRSGPPRPGEGALENRLR